MTHRASDQFHIYQPYTTMYEQTDHHFEKGNSSKNKEELKVHKLIDVPPYPSISYTSNGFEAFRHEKEVHVRKEKPEYPWNNIGYVDQEENSYGKLAYEEEDEEEDVNAEANAFIKWKHDKFNRAKLMSMKYFY
ncbi:hypothetical protein FXO38_36021 [Capsicum annuum]|uniref:uncharacterized protein LOC124889015 n=1 Tax=Capsicum annuum TaxID=4072 RepID=UPI001FB18F07|nr:uncharacterized protein LOC124889015 [Capsicum annuum]KAF3613831.1 hypothetical protein FXO38_36021 [Capsicum annuum]